MVYFLGTDFTDFTVFVVAIGIQVSEFLLRTIHLPVAGEYNIGLEDLTWH